MALGLTGLSAKCGDQGRPELKEWQDEVARKIAKSPKLKALAERNPVVLLHSLDLYRKGGQWATEKKVQHS
jgi:hypothetical protein